MKIREEWRMALALSTDIICWNKLHKTMQIYTQISYCCLEMYALQHNFINMNNNSSEKKIIKAAETEVNYEHQCIKAKRGAPL